ncbi:MAG: NAD(P)H-binding protein [Rhodobacteraceae bacterium]|nr:NAD(P)H-binding protein [Paracoccaceae bacterium]
MKVTLLGSSGTIGRAVLRELRRAGHVISTPDRHTLTALDLAGEDAVISCLASRTGTPKDAWFVDHDLNAGALKAAQSAGVSTFILLSAICVQKPRLAFQHAKLAFEEKLTQSGLSYSIIRPTAYFKSISGQADRLREGKPFLTFGNGTLTACKPISDEDLATYIVSALSDPAMQNKILPIGGPGPALTAREQGELLAEALGVTFRTRSVPPGFLKVIATVLSAVGLREKAALARIGHYYATESMLLWDGMKYDADATPEFGSDTLQAHYQALARGEVVDDREGHAVF